MVLLFLVVEQCSLAMGILQCLMKSPLQLILHQGKPVQLSKPSGAALEESYHWAPESMFTQTNRRDKEEEDKDERRRSRQGGWLWKQMNWEQKRKGGCCLFLGLENMRGGGPHSFLHPLISHIPPWHVQQTLRTAPCAPNTNKGEAAGYWQADILLPPPVCRTETRRGLGI